MIIFFYDYTVSSPLPTHMMEYYNIGVLAGIQRTVTNIYRSPSLHHGVL